MSQEKIKELLEGTVQPEGELQIYLVDTVRKAKEQLSRITSEMKKVDEQFKALQNTYHQIVGVHDVAITDLQNSVKTEKALDASA